jgi:hypothetical protein
MLYSSNVYAEPTPIVQHAMQSPYRKYSLRCTRCGGARFPSSESTISVKQRGHICTENFECWDKTAVALAVEDHDTGYISTAIAVIRGTPDCDEILIEMILVAFHNKLMGPCDQGEVVYVVELH